MNDLINSEISEYRCRLEDKVDAMSKQVETVVSAIVGRPEYGQMGVFTRFDRNEKQIERHKQDQEIELAKIRVSILALEEKNRSANLASDAKHELTEKRIDIIFAKAVGFGAGAGMVGSFAWQLFVHFSHK
jgi:hypothetical protein